MKIHNFREFDYNEGENDVLIAEADCEHYGLKMHGKLYVWEHEEKMWNTEFNVEVHGKKGEMDFGMDYTFVYVPGMERTSKNSYEKLKSAFAAGLDEYKELKAKCGKKRK